MQAIKTKFLGCTNTKGARIVASCANGKIKHVVGYDFSLSHERNHIEAAKQLREKMCWGERMTWGFFNEEYFFTLTTNNGSDRSF